jgi:outer membrane protein TolC
MWWSAFLCAGLLMMGAVAAEEQPVAAVTLSQLWEDAQRVSPGIQAKKRMYEAAKARALTAWLPQDPMAGVDAEGQGSFLDLGSRANNEYMVSQTLPFPTTLWLRAQAASRDAQIAYEQYKEEERDILWHLEQPYQALYLATRTVGALEHIQQLADKLVQTARTRYESSQASQQDVLKANIELAQVDIELIRWQQRAHLAEAHLSHVLNRPLVTAYVVADEAASPWPQASLAELEQLALHTRPELKALEWGIRRAKTSRWLAATSWLPEVTGRWETRRFRNGNPAEHDTFIGVTVPVWSLFKGAGGEWKGAGKDVEAAEAMYQTQKNEVLLAVHEAHAKVTTAEHAVRTYDTLILPQSNQQVEIALAAYEAGREEFLSLIDAQRTLKNAQMAYYEVKADYEIGLADLRRAIGGDWKDGGLQP